jgi:hypothetical protein
VDKLEGIAESLAAAPPEWVADAEAAVLMAARLYPEMFTVNEVRPLMNPDLPQPNTRRALGGVFLKLAREGHIERLHIPCPTCGREREKESMEGNGQYVVLWKAR